MLRRGITNPTGPVLTAIDIASALGLFFRGKQSPLRQLFRAFVMPAGKSRAGDAGTASGRNAAITLINLCAMSERVARAFGDDSRRSE